MASSRPRSPLCAAMIGCDGSQYIKVAGAPYCYLCKAEVERRAEKQKNLKGEHYMEYALARKKETFHG